MTSTAPTAHRSTDVSWADRDRAWNLLVIGGGTAGIVAARTGAGVGASVLLAERARTGGDCLWTGCVPSKALLARSPVTVRATSSGAYSAGHVCWRRDHPRSGDPDGGRGAGSGRWVCAGTCCRTSTGVRQGVLPMCDTRGEFPVAGRDVLLGAPGSPGRQWAPCHLGGGQYERCAHKHLTVDLVEGRGVGFSQAVPEADQSLTRSPGEVARAAGPSR